MLSKEHLVIPGSDYYIYTPSTQAKDLFLYPLIVGHFQYLPGYCQRRISMDNFLIMYINQGRCEVECGGRHFTAHEGQVVLLDCYAPHSYYTSSGWETEWIHFHFALGGSYSKNCCIRWGRQRDISEFGGFQNWSLIHLGICPAILIDLHWIKS